MILRTRLRLQQQREADVGVARVVVDDRELARALLDQRVDQLGRHAGGAEAADHHGGAVVDVGDGFADRVDDLVDHGGKDSRVGRTNDAGRGDAEVMHPARGRRQRAGIVDDFTAVCREGQPLLRKKSAVNEPVVHARAHSNGNPT